jgi:hypothetical protein
MTTFHWAGLVSFIVLCVVAGLIGKKAKHHRWTGIFIDTRDRYSLTHFQLVCWTIVILSSLMAVFIATWSDPASIELTPELLGLMGVSAGSAVLATGVKAMKDARDSIGFVNRGTTPRFSQVWSEEEGVNPAQEPVNVTKFQNLIFTIVILIYYVVKAIDLSGLPVFPQSIIWLIGISHAGYVGGKVPDKLRVTPPSEGDGLVFDAQAHLARAQDLLARSRN